MIVPRLDLSSEGKKEGPNRSENDEINLLDKNQVELVVICYVLNYGSLLVRQLSDLVSH